MSFPEIKRVEPHKTNSWSSVFRTPPARYFVPAQLKEERLSRAKWAQTLERKLNESKNLMIDNKKDAAWFVIGQVAGELLRQAEIDEGGLK